MAVKYSPVKVEHINPFVIATVTAFRTMLNCELKRGELYTKDTASLTTRSAA